MFFIPVLLSYSFFIPIFLFVFIYLFAVLFTFYIYFSPTYSLLFFIIRDETCILLLSDISLFYFYFFSMCYFCSLFTKLFCSIFYNSFFLCIFYYISYESILLCPDLFLTYFNYLIRLSSLQFTDLIWTDYFIEFKLINAFNLLSYYFIFCFYLSQTDIYSVFDISVYILFYFKYFIAIKFCDALEFLLRFKTGSLIYLSFDWYYLFSTLGLFRFLVVGLWSDFFIERLLYSFYWR